MIFKNQHKFKRRFTAAAIITSLIGVSLVACAPTASNILEKNEQNAITRGKKIPVYATAKNDENFYTNPRTIFPWNFNNSLDKMDFQISPINNIVSYPTIFPPSFLVTKNQIPINSGDKDGFNYWKTVASLTNEQLHSDIYNSLVNLADNSNLSINFSSLQIEINKVLKGSEDAVVDRLFIKFQVSNLSNLTYKLYNAIDLLPLSNATITISLVNGAIDLLPWYIHNNDVRDNTLAATWKLGNLNPQAKTVNKLRVELDYDTNYTTEKQAVLELPELEILSSRSYALNIFFKNFGVLPSYNQIQPLAMLELQKLSNTDLKNDLNNWFLVYWKQKMLSSWNDIVASFQYLTTTNIVLPNGRKTNLLMQLIEDGQQRSVLLKSMGLPNSVQKLIESILAPREGYTPPTYAQIYVMFKSLEALNLSEWIEQNIQFVINWIKLPQIDWTDFNNPKISFAFDYQLNFMADLSVPLSGTGEYEGAKTDWKLSDYIVIKNIIAVFTGSDSVGKTDFIGNAINQIQQYINWTSLEFKKGDAISWKYDAQNSPFQFYIAPTFDQSNLPNATFGWQVSDVQTTYNFSKLKSFWKTFYQPLVDVDGTTFSLLGGDIDKVKAGDVEALIKFLNYVYKTDNNSAIQELFQTLTTQNYTIQSMPLYVNLSQAFYQLPTEIDNQPLWTASAVDLTSPKSTSLSQDVSNLKVSLRNLFNPANNLIQGNFSWKNFALKEMGLNYSFTYFANDYTLIPSFENGAAIKKIFDKYKTDTEFEANVKTEITQLIKSSNLTNLANPSLIPQISLVKVPLKQAINDGFEKPAFTTAFSSILSFASWFGGPSEAQIRAIPGELVQRNPYAVIINTQLPGAYASLDEGDNIRLNDANSYLWFFASPILNMSKLNIPKLGF